MSDIDHTRDCILPSDGRAEGLVRASELFALAAERDALRAENERLRAELHTASDMNAVYEGRLQEKEADNARMKAEIASLTEEFGIQNNDLGKALLENERLRAALRMWEDAVKIDVKMQGPQYAGVRYLEGREAWKATCAALEEKP